MPTDAFWLDDLQDATLTTDSGAGTDDTLVAGVQSVAISGEVSIEQLFTADSIKIEEQKQHEFQVDIEIGASLWDYEFVRDWLGGSGSAADTMADDSSPQKFTLSLTHDSVQGDRTVDIEVTGITFASMPVLDASRGEYVEWSPSGTGETLEVTTTDNTAT